MKNSNDMQTSMTNTSTRSNVIETPIFMIVLPVLSILCTFGISYISKQLGTIATFITLCSICFFLVLLVICLQDFFLVCLVIK
jgi:hypothetical protein